MLSRSPLATMIAAPASIHWSGNVCHTSQSIAKPQASALYSKGAIADASPLRGRVIGAEYLGTTQIVTVTTASGQVKARLPSNKAVQVGETVGLALRPDRLSLFDAISGQALHSSLYEGGARG